MQHLQGARKPVGVCRGFSNAHISTFSEQNLKLCVTHLEMCSYHLKVHRNAFGNHSKLAQNRTTVPANNSIWQNSTLKFSDNQTRFSVVDFLALSVLRTVTLWCHYPWSIGAVWMWMPFPTLPMTQSQQESNSSHPGDSQIKTLISLTIHVLIVGVTRVYKKAVLSQRWPRNAPYIWVAWKFSGLPKTWISQHFHGLLFRSTVWMFLQNLKSVALPVSEIIGGTQKIWAVPGYAHDPFSPKFLMGFY